MNGNKSSFISHEQARKNKESPTYAVTNIEGPVIRASGCIGQRTEDSWFATHAVHAPELAVLGRCNQIHHN